MKIVLSWQVSTKRVQEIFPGKYFQPPIDVPSVEEYVSGDPNASPSNAIGR
jgi:hypothetical protein